ncbi:hypothetical protein BH10BAC4_BH10BAC4_14680 [soil metagenome]
MPSIVPGFEYDIFISYRHNDNAYDAWVSEFVEKLRRELVATVKDKLTVFFDANPEDGLKESHLVDHTISSKIKALIFIPIVSQTYCDTKSFAWNNEFLLFSKAAANDTFGREVKLPNGNVASRILPIKIHEIEKEDVGMLENVLQGALRSIDFIYHAQGVNRPLRPKDDDRLDNGHHTIYRNQINKVANAIKEIVNGIKGHDSSRISQTEFVNSSTLKVPEMPRWYNTTVPSDIRVAVLDIPQPTVFLPWTSNDLKAKREEMAIILTRAGFQVIPNSDCPSVDEDFKKSVSDNLERASCSLHILSGEFGRRFEEEDEVSYPMYQFEMAKTKSAANGSKFYTLVWYLEDPTKPVKPQQEQFINNIRNYITPNMTFTNAFSPMQLVEDMRSLLLVEKNKELDTKDTDIFFIFNKQDAKDAYPLTDLISKDYTVEVMNILPGGEQQYRQLSTQQIPKSKLAVVYFRYGADWALPFIKQVWKEVGGASSPTQMMLVGESDPETNMARIFKAPKVSSSIVPKADVPDEVKKTYDKFTK